MAQYKVPQDVEAEDKLIGPFTFRQFIYLIIAAAFLAAAWGLFSVFPLLVIIPLPFAGFFAALALPLKKDQPMETYFAAVINYHLRPRKRYWLSGQRESTIIITAPKTIEKPRSRNITEDEASHRLSFLADIIDTEGYSIRNGSVNSAIREEYIAEANSATDILDRNRTANFDQMIAQEQQARRNELVSQMRTAIANAESLTPTPTNYVNYPPSSIPPAQLNQLANSDYSIQTIQNQANHLNNNGY